MSKEDHYLQKRFSKTGRALRRLINVHESTTQEKAHLLKTKIKQKVAIGVHSETNCHFLRIDSH